MVKVHVFNLSSIFVFFFRAISSVSQHKLLFVEKPSIRFFCPLTNCLLLEPYLTSCCGQHLSEAAISMIDVGAACPMCKIHNWNTTLDKHFQRKVKALLVICHYKDEGCSWQGELAALDYHTQSCPFKDTRLLPRLQ